MAIPPPLLLFHMSSRQLSGRPSALRRYSWLTLRGIIAAGILIGVVALVFAGLGSSYTFNWIEALKFLPRFNQGLIVTEARDAVVERGITINGLPVMLRAGQAAGVVDLKDVDVYYED